MSRVSKGKVQYLKSLYQVLNSHRSITDFIVGKFRGGNNRIYLPGSMGKHKYNEECYGVYRPLGIGKYYKEELVDTPNESTFDIKLDNQQYLLACDAAMDFIDKVPTLEHGLTKVWDEAHVIDDPDSFSNLNKEFIDVRSNWCNELEPKVGFYDRCKSINSEFDIETMHSITKSSELVVK